MQPLTETSNNYQTRRVKPARVVVIDDHPAIRCALENTISRQPDMEFCGEADSAKEAIPVIEETQPDIVIVDLSLSDVHGLDLVNGIRTRCPQTAVVVYSMYDEHYFAERALRAGASAYVMKDESTLHLVDAIRSVLDGNIYISPRQASRMLSRLSHRRQTEQSGRGLHELTDREMEIFQLLGEGVNVKEISARLNLSIKTVESYRRRVRKKLGFDSVSGLLQYAVSWKCN